MAEFSILPPKNPDFNNQPWTKEALWKSGRPVEKFQHSTAEKKYLRLDPLKRVWRTYSCYPHHPFHKAAQYRPERLLSLWFLPGGKWARVSGHLSSPAIWHAGEESPPLSRSTQNTEVCCTTGGGGEGLEQQPGLSKGSTRMWLLPTTSDSIRKLVHESVGTPPLQISPAGLQTPPKLCTHPHKLPNSIVSSLCVPPSGSNECKFLQAATKHTQKATHICSRAQTWASSTTLGKANKRPWATGLTLQDWEKAYKHKDSTQKGNKNCRTSASIAKI